MGGMAAILAGGGILFSLALAWQMVPGSRQGFPLSLVLALSGIGVIGGIALFFPWQTSHAFVSEGWPCAAMELMIAVPATVIFWLLARRGALFASAGLGARFDRLGRLPGLSASSIPVHVPARAASPGLACRNGGGPNWVGRADRRITAPSLDVVNP